MEEKYRMKIRNYCETDVPTMVRIWNEVIEEGVAFPQLDFIFFTRTMLVVAVTL